MTLSRIMREYVVTRAGGSIALVHREGTVVWWLGLQRRGLQECRVTVVVNPESDEAGEGYGDGDDDGGNVLANQLCV